MTSRNDFYWKELDGMKLLVSSALERAGFVNGFSTRLGGVSPYPEGDLNLAGFGEDTDENIFENRRRFLRFFDERYSITTTWQVHGDDVKLVKDLVSAKETEEKFDALVSRLPDLLLGVKTADCVPVLIGDSRTGAYGAVHAGWRGTLSEIVKNAVGKMEEEFGSSADELVCAIGPAACGERYEVGPEVVEAFTDRFSTGGNLFRSTTKGHALIDLHKANRLQLSESGVKDSNIHTAAYCTMERTDLFFSYRVEKRTLGRTGRLMSVIGRAQP